MKRIIFFIAFLCLYCIVLGAESENDRPVYRVPNPIPRGPNSLVLETFDDDSWQSSWLLTKDEEYTGA